MTDVTMKEAQMILHDISTNTNQCTILTILGVPDPGPGYYYNLLCARLVFSQDKLLRCEDVVFLCSPRVCQIYVKIPFS